MRGASGVLLASVLDGLPVLAGDDEFMPEDDEDFDELVSAGVVGLGTVLLSVLAGAVLLSIELGEVLGVVGAPGVLLLVDDGAAFGSVGETAAAPWAGVAASVLGDCECEMPTAALSAAAAASATQVIGLLMIG